MLSSAVSLSLQSGCSQFKPTPGPSVRSRELINKIQAKVSGRMGHSGTSAASRCRLAKFGAGI